MFIISYWCKTGEILYSAILYTYPIAMHMCHGWHIIAFPVSLTGENLTIFSPDSCEILTMYFTRIRRDSCKILAKREMHNALSYEISTKKLQSLHCGPCLLNELSYYGHDGRRGGGPQCKLCNFWVLISYDSALCIPLFARLSQESGLIHVRNMVRISQESVENVVRFSPVRLTGSCI